MKINQMWAMFDEDGIFYSYTIFPTRREVIKEMGGITDPLGWQWLYNRGYRIKKVVVLPVDKAGGFLPRREA